MATSSKTICKAFRVVVCAAILTGSLFGRALHDLHHTLDVAFRVNSAELDGSSLQPAETEVNRRCAAHCHPVRKPFSGLLPAEERACPGRLPDGDHSHDSGNCSICFVLNIQFDCSGLVAIEPVALRILEYVPVADEEIVEECLASASARGPPFEA